MLYIPMAWQAAASDVLERLAALGGPPDVDLDLDQCEAEALIMEAYDLVQAIKASNKERENELG